jgi:hypothetical protein
MVVEKWLVGAKDKKHCLSTELLLYRVLKVEYLLLNSIHTKVISYKVTFLNIGSGT